MYLFKFLPVIVALLAVGFATPAYAPPRDACMPWPGCKDEGSGDPPGLSNCNVEYTGIPGSCMNRDEPTAQCVLVRPNDNTPGWIFTDHCQTFAPLIIKPENPFLDGDGHTLELVVPWTFNPATSSGRAAIENSGGTALVRDLKINVDSPAVANGSCVLPTAIVQTAISFDPHKGTSGLPSMKPVNVEITANFASGAQFCNAIEYVSESGQDEEPFFGGGVSGNVIGPDSYSSVGILVSNINSLDNISGNNPSRTRIGDNRVHSSANGCVGIQVGPWVERANIENNDVALPGCAIGVGAGVGISVITTGVANDGMMPPPQEFEAALPADVVGNIVNVLDGDSFDVGISIVASAIGKNESNEITGNAFDRPYCVDSSSISFPTHKKRKNTFNDGTMTTTIMGGGPCPP